MTIETREVIVLRIKEEPPEKKAMERKISLIGFCDRCGSANKVYDVRRD